MLEESGHPSHEHAPAATRLWGIGWVPWLWAVDIRILFVIDGRITQGYTDYEFGLGPVLDTLRASFAWWVDLSVRVVVRDEPHSFRFTQDGFDIDDFDQVWFFGDWPGEDANFSDVTDDIIQRAEYSPLDDAELRIVAEWMERGGGVFATGDHSLLGASMCSRIPRVRNMRKWTRAQGVPSFGEEDRHETLVHVQSGILSWEGDRWGQQIWPVYRHRSHGPFYYQRFPHPLLCGRTGVIDRFPDHMHEGGVIEDDAVRLRDPLGIPGYAGEEFPVIPSVFEGARALVADPFGVRPRPQVIAHGLTSNTDAEIRRFALIGVYDGDPVRIGRVVVDSTWHHWFSMNLLGFQAEAPVLYRQMQDYYRNVGLWLATPRQRAYMLFAATWGALVGTQPGAFDRVMGIWELGERVVDVIGRTAPQCIVAELVATFLSVEDSPALPDPPLPDSRRPARLRPPVSLVNEAVMGGVALELVDLAHRHFKERAHGRSSVVDVEAVRRMGFQGVSAGVRELAATYAENAKNLGSVRDVKPDAFEHFRSDRIKRVEDPTV